MKILRYPYTVSILAVVVVAVVNFAAWSATIRWVAIVQESQDRTGGFPDPPRWWRAASLSTGLYWNFNLIMGAVCLGVGIAAIVSARRLKTGLLGIFVGTVSGLSGLLLVALSMIGTF